MCLAGSSTGAAPPLTPVALLTPATLTRMTQRKKTKTSSDFKRENKVSVAGCLPKCRKTVHLSTRLLKLLLCDVVRRKVVLGRLVVRLALARGQFLPRLGDQP